MATNDFLPFAVGAGANVLSQTDYAAQTAIASGYSAGIAKSAALNKTWRQSSIMAAVLAQFISDQTGANSVDDGTTATLLANLKKSMPGRLLKTTVLSTAGSSTFTPLAATTAVDVEVVGGGGAGGGTAVTSSTQVAAGAGGAGGGYARKYLTSGFSGVTVTVGAAGVASTGAAGTAGGTSSFGAAASATGGAGGQLGTAQTAAGQNTFVGGAIGGAGSGGDLNGVGGFGNAAYYSPTPISGKGGFSEFGEGGTPAGSTSAGLSGVSPGSGGSGASTLQSNASTIAGGAGKAGIVIIREYA